FVSPGTASDRIHETELPEDSMRMCGPPSGSVGTRRSTVRFPHRRRRRDPTNGDCHVSTALAVVALVVGVAMVVAGAELFAEHLEGASRRLGVSAFAVALLLAGAEPEELATTVAASLRKVPAVAFGDVGGANIAMCLVALPVGALVAPLPFGRKVRRYALLAMPLGVVAAAAAWGARGTRPVGALL